MAAKWKLSRPHVLALKPALKVVKATPTWRKGIGGTVAENGNQLDAFAERTVNLDTETFMLNFCGMPVVGSLVVV